jgi:predicted porin
MKMQRSRQLKQRDMHLNLKIFKSEFYPMRKSLIALAVLASVSSAAFAQSSVNIFGRVDASIGNEEIDGVSTTKMFSGTLAPSRLGFIGSEDLGAGLRARFALEGSLNVDDGTGSAGGLQFNRASWVGMSGGFGEFRAGLVASPYKDIFDLGVSNNVYDSAFTPTNIAYISGAVGTATGVTNFVGRPSNVIRYDTPSFAGFSGGVAVSFDENVAPSTANSAVTAFNLRYRSGPLDAGVGIQEQSNDTAALDRSFTVVSAAYDFKSFRVSGQFQASEQSNGVEDQDFAIGVTVPLGAKFDVSAGVAVGESEQNGVSSGKSSAFSIGATYGLSARTRLYAGLSSGEVEDGLGAITRESRLIAVGLQHNF